ncbi:MAG: deoxyadenosine/deoxycytidine kinase [Bradymonadia bacterium]|jgi:deoxyadenosine/deoxycytidine kinase
MAGPKYIAVAGNIGAGKSTLVEFLRYKFNLTPFYEPNADNPFMVDFYSDMKRWGFHSQIFFLTHKFRLHQELTEHPGTVVQDRTIYEDAEIFAENLFRSGNMTADEYAIYRTLYDGIVRTLRPPDLMIYLRAEVRTVRRRIKHRGRPEEQALPLSYIKRLHSLYEDWFANYDRSPTLVIEVDRLDYIQDMVDRIEIIRTIEQYL